MQYRIDSNGLLPTSNDTQAIDAKIGLSLGRFNNLISDCEIGFMKETVNDSHITRCNIHVVLFSSTDFVISDYGKDNLEAFRSALERIKRNIERHLKRQNASRMNKSLGNRLI